MFDHMKKTKVIAALTAGMGVACDAYGSANADTAKLAQLQRQLASVDGVGDVRQNSGRNLPDEKSI